MVNILISVNTLRHSAVHRFHTTAKGILEMIRSATSFARVLRDLTCQHKLEELHQELKGKIRVLELNKNFLETRVEREMQDIAEQRKLLEEREQQVLVNMLREDKDYGSLIGSLLSQSVDQIFDKVKEDTSEPSEPEQNFAPVTNEKKEEPILNHEKIHKAKSDFFIEAKSLAGQHLELEKFEPSLGYWLLKTAQSAPSSPCIDGEALYESKDSERETRDLVSKKPEATQEVYGTSPFESIGCFSLLMTRYLVAGVLDEEGHTALSKAVDLRLTAFNLSTGNFKKLAHNRMQRVRSFVKQQTGFDVSAYQVCATFCPN